MDENGKKGQLKDTLSQTYEKIQDTTVGERNTAVIELWKMKILPSAQNFAWRVLINKITTKNKLISKGITLSSSLCVICRRSTIQ